MTSSLYHELSLLNNFGVDTTENLDMKEKLERHKKYLENITFSKCFALFCNVEDFLLDEENISKPKEEIIMLTIHGIENYSFLEENVDKLPCCIKDLYESYLEFGRMCLIFEKIAGSEITMTEVLENILTEYINFLLKTKHEFFIHNCYSRIEKFTERIMSYLRQENTDGVRHIDVINYDIIAFIRNRVDKVKKKTC